MLEIKYGKSIQSELNRVEKELSENLKEFRKSKKKLSKIVESYKISEINGDRKTWDQAKKDFKVTREQIDLNGLPMTLCEIAMKWEE